MNKNIKVAKISLDVLEKLQKAGFIVEIQQITVKPANPRPKYALKDTISVLQQTYKRGLESDPKDLKDVKSLPHLKALKKRLGVSSEQN